jgi:hypothetical protein
MAGPCPMPITFGLQGIILNPVCGVLWTQAFSVTC